MTLRAHSAKLNSVMDVEREGSVAPDLGADSPQAQLVANCYKRLRILARRLLGEGGHAAGVDPTEVVHECYMRLEKLADFRNLGEGPFFVLAATSIRHVLVELARRNGAAKRGGNFDRVTLDDNVSLSRGERLDLLDLEEALGRLAVLHPRQARVVELRLFGGLDLGEIARLLEVAERTVSNDWAMARAWLAVQLG